MDKNRFDDDDVNFNEIQRELSAAVARDAKYERENDAKFRAINQKVASYDEFRDIVAASHLKPLDRSDKLGGMSYQKWNVHCTGKDNAPQVQNENENQTKKYDPNTSADFIKIWKRECKSDGEKYELLISTKTELLEKFFAVECPLGEVVTVLNTINTIENQWMKIVRILHIMGNSKRFKLQLDFLSSMEKGHLRNVFEKIRPEITNNYKILEQFTELLKLYECQL